MKSLPAGLAAHYALEVTTTAVGLKITRTDGEVIAITTADLDAEIDGVDYLADPGLNASAIVGALGFAVGTHELATLHDGSVFTMEDVKAGVWSHAAFQAIRYNWANVADGVEDLQAGHFGEVELFANKVVAELRDLRQLLQQGVGLMTQPTCRNRLYVNDGIHSRCPVVEADFTESFTVTSVDSKQAFRASALAQADDHFAGEGAVVTWLTGDNAGLSMTVSAFSATPSGSITLTRPMILTIQVGDTGEITAGCRKRLEEDCRDKFDAVVGASSGGFNGEAHMPGADAVIQPAEISA